MLFTNVLAFSFYVPISKHVTVVSCCFESTNTPTQQERVMKRNAVEREVGGGDPDGEYM